MSSKRGRMVLNSGANLLVRPRVDGRVFGIHNLCPVIAECADGGRHAIGFPGGPRIPAIVLRAAPDPRFSAAIATA